MILTKTPFRISFVGGGSDMEEYYQHSPGAVLSVSINKFMYIAIHRFFHPGKIQIKYSRTELVGDINAIRHPIVREIMKQFHVRGGLEINSIADVPSGTGLGSSSSFTVGMLHNMYATGGRIVTKQQLAEEACNIEINRLGEPIGKQDQYISAFGGLNIITFQTTGAVTVEPIHLPQDTYRTFQQNLLIFYLGKQRKASHILAEQKRKTGRQLQLGILRDMVGLVSDLRNALYKGRLDQVGAILDQNWQLKKRLASRISTPWIDDVYGVARRHGAIGGKLLGAGGGGFLLMYCPRQRQAKLRAALRKFQELPFAFDSEGSKVIYIGDDFYGI